MPTLLVKFFKISQKYVALCLLVSCSTLMQGDNVRRASEYKQITDFVKDFKKEALRYGIRSRISNVPISFIKYKKNDVIATCYSGGLFNFITINNDIWDNYSYLEKKMIIFHELGHCILDRDHIEDVHFINPLPELPDGCPLSIMTITITYLYCFQYHYGMYIRELFTTKE